MKAPGFILAARVRLRSLKYRRLIVRELRGGYYLLRSSRGQTLVRGNLRKNGILAAELMLCPAIVARNGIIGKLEIYTAKRSRVISEEVDRKSMVQKGKRYKGGVFVFNLDRVPGL